MKTLENKTNEANNSYSHLHKAWSKRDTFEIVGALLINLCFVGGILYMSRNTSSYDSPTTPTKVRIEIYDTTYYYQDSISTKNIVLRDFDHDGLYDWKTIYHWKDGMMIGIETTAKESWYNKFGIQERRHLANIVSDSTKIE
jgi:hypothetical protein